MRNTMLTVTATWRLTAAKEKGIANHCKEWWWWWWLQQQQ
jgi:hypothetical protein